MVPGVNDTVEIFQQFMDSRLADIHTFIPGKILSYDPDKRLAKVQPCIKQGRQTAGGKKLMQEIPPIDNVPCVITGSGDFVLKFPIKSGTGCGILFAENGIGNWINAGCGLISNPDDFTRFSLTDAICIPGLFPPSGAAQLIPTIELDESGQLKFLSGNSSFVKGEDLESLLNNFLTACAGIVPGTTAQNAAALTAIKGAATAALTTLPNIKSTKIKGE